MGESAGQRRLVIRRLVGIRPAAQSYLETTIMPNSDVLVWVSDDLDERFEVVFVGPYA